MIWDHLRPDSVWGVVFSGCGLHRGGETSWDCHFSTVGFTVLVGRHLCNNSYYVILLMMRRKFCFFLKVYRFLRWWHIDILNGRSIYFPRCHVLCYLTMLYTHTYEFSVTYVICMCDFMKALSEMTKFNWSQINKPSKTKLLYSIHLTRRECMHYFLLSMNHVIYLREIPSQKCNASSNVFGKISLTPQLFGATKIKYRMTLEIRWYVFVTKIIRIWVTWLESRVFCHSVIVMFLWTCKTALPNHVCICNSSVAKLGPYFSGQWQLSLETMLPYTLYHVAIYD